MEAFSDVLAGRVPNDMGAFPWLFLTLVVLLSPIIRRLWLVARRGLDPEAEGEVIDAVESRAFLEAVERHDLLLEAQRLAAEKADVDLDGEPTDRGFEARIAARMKERGDPG